MNELYKICAAAVVSLSAVLVLRESNSSFAELVALFFGICVIARTVIGIAEVTNYLKELVDGSEAEGHLKVLLKAAGIAYITDFTADICRDAGVGNIATYVEFFGRCELLLLSLPLMSSLLELSFTLLKL